MIGNVGNVGNVTYRRRRIRACQTVPTMIMCHLKIAEHASITVRHDCSGSR